MTSGGMGRKPRIALMGEFSAGKSTLSNLLMGVRPLPEKVTATRLSPVWITYGTDAPYRMDVEGYSEPIEIARLELEQSLELDLTQEVEGGVLVAEVLEAGPQPASGEIGRVAGEHALLHPVVEHEEEGVVHRTPLPGPNAVGEGDRDHLPGRIEFTLEVVVGDGTHATLRDRVPGRPQGGSPASPVCRTRPGFVNRPGGDRPGERCRRGSPDDPPRACCQGRHRSHPATPRVPPASPRTRASCCPRSPAGDRRPPARSRRRA